MKVIIVNNIVESRGSGPERYLKNLESQLGASGISTERFGFTATKNNYYRPFSYVHSRSHSMSSVSRVKKVWFSLFSLFNPIVALKYLRCLNKFKPTHIVILQYRFKLSLSVLIISFLKGLGNVKVMVRMSDFGLICQQNIFRRDNNDCYLCLEKNNLQGIINNCRGNFFQSAYYSFALTVEKKMIEFFKPTIIATCDTSKDLFERFFCNKSIKVEKHLTPVSNTVLPQLPPKELAFDLIYVGRVSADKGIDDVLKAVKKYNAKEPRKIRLALVGPVSDDKYDVTDAYISVLGGKSHTDVENLMSKSRAVILPSIWIENLPNTLLEALAIGKVVIYRDRSSLHEILGKLPFNRKFHTHRDLYDLLFHVHELPSYVVEHVDYVHRNHNLKEHVDGLFASF